jgi:hypothetical protein
MHVVLAVCTSTPNVSHRQSTCQFSQPCMCLRLSLTRFSNTTSTPLSALTQWFHRCVCPPLGSPSTIRTQSRTSSRRHLVRSPHCLGAPLVLEPLLGALHTNWSQAVRATGHGARHSGWRQTSLSLHCRRPTESVSLSVVEMTVESLCTWHTPGLHAHAARLPLTHSNCTQSRGVWWLGDNRPSAPHLMHEPSSHVLDVSGLGMRHLL